jgi:hypothetical protein
MDKRLEIKRPVAAVIVACLLIAAAPWLSGGQEPLAMLIGSGALLMAVMLVGRQGLRRPTIDRRLAWAYGLMIGWGTLSWFWSANRFCTVEWLWMAVGAGVVFWLAAALDEWARRWLVTGYLVSAAIFGLHGLWLYVVAPFPRLTGSFYWPNPAAAYLMPAIILAAESLREAGRRIWMWMAALVLYGVAFGLCDSRAAGLVLVAAATVYLARARSLRLCIKILLAFCMVVLVTVGCIQIRHVVSPTAASTVPGARVVMGQTADSNSLVDRMRFIQAADSMWHDHLWGGVGAGTFGTVHALYQRGVTDASIDAHNFFVQLLAELGLVGLGLFAWLIWSVVAGIGGGRAKGYANEALILVLAALIIHFGLDIDASYPALLWLAAMFGGVLYKSGDVAQSGRLRWQWVTALALMMVIIAASAYQSEVWARRGQAAQQDADYSLATDNFARAHSVLAYNPDWLTAEGINDLALAAEGDREGAAAALELGRQAARMDPDDAQHYYLQGRALAMQGKQAEAESELRRALILEPHSRPEYARSLAELLRARGRLDEAKAVAVKMLDQYDDKTLAARSNDPELRPALAGLAAVLAGVYRDGGDAAGARMMSARAKAIYSGKK